MFDVTPPPTESMNRKWKNVGHLISLQSTSHIPTAAEVEQPEPRSEGHAEPFKRFHQVLHHFFFFSFVSTWFMHDVGERRPGFFLREHGKSLNTEHCIGDFLFHHGDSGYIFTACVISLLGAMKYELRVYTIGCARKRCELLTVFMSMLMLVCDGVWLSEGEQELGEEEEAWTRPVCRARHRCHVLIIKCHLMLLVSPQHRHSGSLLALMVCLKRTVNGVRMHYVVCQD